MLNLLAQIVALINGVLSIIGFILNYIKKKSEKGWREPQFYNYQM